MKRSFMFICAAALLLTGCGASADEASAQLFAMDTVMQLDAYGHQVKQAVSDAEETIQALEARLSRTRSSSSSSRFALLKKIRAAVPGTAAAKITSIMVSIDRTLPLSRPGRRARFGVL